MLYYKHDSKKDSRQKSGEFFGDFSGFFEKRSANMRHWSCVTSMKSCKNRMDKKYEKEKANSPSPDIDAVLHYRHTHLRNIIGPTPASSLSFLLVFCTLDFTLKFFVYFQKIQVFGFFEKITLYRVSWCSVPPGPFFSKKRERKFTFLLFFVFFSLIPHVLNWYSLGVYVDGRRTVKNTCVYFPHLMKEFQSHFLQQIGKVYSCLLFNANVFSTL